MSDKVYIIKQRIKRDESLYKADLSATEKDENEKYLLRGQVCDGIVQMLRNCDDDV